jgi:hypothetical protein
VAVLQTDLVAVIAEPLLYPAAGHPLEFPSRPCVLERRSAHARGGLRGRREGRLQASSNDDACDPLHPMTISPKKLTAALRTHGRVPTADSFARATKRTPTGSAASRAIGRSDTGGGAGLALGALCEPGGRWSHRWPRRDKLVGLCPVLQASRTVLVGFRVCVMPPSASRPAASLGARTRLPEGPAAWGPAARLGGPALGIRGGRPMPLPADAWRPRSCGRCCGSGS